MSQLKHAASTLCWVGHYNSLQIVSQYGICLSSHFVPLFLAVTLGLVPIYMCFIATLHDPRNNEQATTCQVRSGCKRDIGSGIRYLKSCTLYVWNTDARCDYATETKAMSFSPEYVHGGKQPQKRQPASASSHLASYTPGRDSF